MTTNRLLQRNNIFLNLEFNDDIFILPNEKTPLKFNKESYDLFNLNINETIKINWDGLYNIQYCIRTQFEKDYSNRLVTLYINNKKMNEMKKGLIDGYISEITYNEIFFLKGNDIITLDILQFSSETMKVLKNSFLKIIKIN